MERRMREILRKDDERNMKYEVWKGG